MKQEARLIDANQLPKQHELLIGRGMTAIVPYAAIENAPTVEAEPVVHAYWISISNDDNWGACSNCVRAVDMRGERAKYERCPHCGAKMDLEG